MENFVYNLRNLCAEKKSVAQACRDIGIRQQQFSRYLSGASHPSAHTLRKICDYFKIREQDLFLDNSQFSHLRKADEKNRSLLSYDPMASVYPGELKKLKKYLGAYLHYSDSPSWPGRYTVGATFLTEENNQVLVRTIESTNPDSMQGYPKSRYNGKACYYEGRIFISEFEKRNSGCLSQTILIPPHRQQTRYLKGLLIGLASKPRRTPFACRTIWKKMPEYYSAREVIARSQFPNHSSTNVDPVVKRYLDSDEPTQISTYAVDH